MIKTFIVTGANRGLGYETARQLAENHDHFVILGGRDLGAVSASAQTLKTETGNDRILPLFLDLSDLQTVHAFVDSLGKEKIESIDGLICNAGISKNSVDDRSVQGYEMTFAVNHLGHFLLINLLLEQMATNGRILIVSSNAHNPEKAGGPLRPPRFVKAEWLAWPERDPNLPEVPEIAGSEAYANSKLCNVLMTYELDRRLTETHPDKKITVNAFAPGLMAGTGLGREGKGFIRVMWYVILPFASRFIPTAKSTPESGNNLAWLATAEEVATISGAYFFARAQQESSADSHDLEMARDLWETSEMLVQLTSPLEK